MKVSTLVLSALSFTGSVMSKPVHRLDHDGEGFMNVVEDLTKLNAHTFYARDIIRFIRYDRNNGQGAMERFIEEFPKLETLAQRTSEDVQNTNKNFKDHLASTIMHHVTDWTRSTQSLLNTMQDEAHYIRKEMPDMAQQVPELLQNYGQQVDETMKKMGNVMAEDRDEEWIKKHRERLCEELKKTAEKYNKDEGGESKYRRVHGGKGDLMDLLKELQRIL